jgi:hypothetical protein
MCLRILFWIESQRFPPFLSYWNFIFFCLTLWSIIHFKFILYMACGVDQYSFCVHSFLVLKHYVSEKLCFSHCTDIVLLSEVSWLFVCRSISVLSIISFTYIPFFMPSTPYLITTDLLYIKILSYPAILLIIFHCYFGYCRYFTFLYI